MNAKQPNEGTSGDGVCPLSYCAGAARAVDVAHLWFGQSDLP